MKQLVVQIGANIGKDFVYDFLNKSEIGYRVWLVEPNPYAMTQCKENYKDLMGKHEISFLEVAIYPSDTEEYIDMYYPAEDNASTITSIDPDFITRHSAKSRIETIKTKVISINYFLENYIQKKTIEYMFIDTEGYDVRILNNINFNDYDIHNITYEYIHSDGVLSYGGKFLNQLNEKLVNLGYSISKQEYNIIAKK